MKEINQNLWQASLISGLSELQLWILIQNRIIVPLFTHQETTINIKQLRDWMLVNNRTTVQLQLRVDERDMKFSLKNNIIRWRNQ